MLLLFACSQDQEPTPTAKATATVPPPVAPTPIVEPTATATPTEYPGFRKYYQKRCYPGWHSYDASD